MIKESINDWKYYNSVTISRAWITKAYIEVTYTEAVADNAIFFGHNF
jgi:hypothetical protein